MSPASRRHHRGAPVGRATADGHQRERPVSRLRAAAGLVAALALLVAAGSGLSLLRHTDELGAGAPPIAISDPRTPLDCGEPAPREGQERDPELPAAAERVAVPAGSGPMLDCPQIFDGRRVRFQGEAVGQVLGRGERVWVQLNDDVYGLEAGPLPGHRVFAGLNSGLGVSLPSALAAQIGARGGPGRRGDLVTVEGVFRRVDPATGEIAVILADAIQIDERGGPVPVAGRTDRAAVAGLLSALALGLGVVQRRRRDR